MNFVDKALARRLESAEEVPQVHFARVYARSHPGIPSTVEKICGGHAVFAGLGSPVGHAAGLGLDRTLNAEDLDRLEAFYRTHGAPAQVDVCPLHEPPVLEMFKRRGYAIAELNNVLWRPLAPLEPMPTVPEDVVIRPARPQEAHELADILARCFHEDVDPPEGFQQMLAPLYEMPGVISFVSSIAGKPVGVGAGLVIPEHRVLALFGAGTLTEYRRRGIQAALLGVRMQAGADAGCEIAVIVTQGGTTSQRNCERLGFRVAYSKATLIKSFESPS